MRIHGLIVRVHSVIIGVNGLNMSVHGLFMRVHDLIMSVCGLIIRAHLVGLVALGFQQGVSSGVLATSIFSS